jgi:hypothetical protein
MLCRAAKFAPDHEELSVVAIESQFRETADDTGS